MQKLSITEFKERITQGAVIIDARPTNQFVEGFIEEAISIPFNEDFLAAFQELIAEDQEVLIVAEEADTARVIKMLTASGFATVAGYLDGGFEAWLKGNNKFDMLITIDADEFAIDYQFDEFFLLDIRAKEDFEQEHVEDAENAALPDLEQLIMELDSNYSYYVYGNTEAEAVTAGSLFKRYGVERIRTVAATYEVIKQTGIALFKQKKKDQKGSKTANEGQTEK